MKTFHIKRNDVVTVIAGSQKGKSGKVLEIIAAKERARVEGLAMIKRHIKKGSDKSAEQGGIIEREGTIHISNLQLKADYDASKKRAAAAKK